MTHEISHAGMTHEISHANVSAVDGILQVDSMQFNIINVCVGYILHGNYIFMSG